MTRKRRTFGAAFKAKVALAAAKGDRTTAQLASEYGVHAGQVTAWKKQLMEQVTDLFADGRKRQSAEATNEHELYEQIGRLKMEVEWLKKNLPRSAEVKRRCVETDHESLSVSRQCQLLGLARSSWYHVPQGESAENLALMRAIDELYTKRPFSGSRTVCKHRVLPASLRGMPHESGPSEVSVGSVGFPIKENADARDRVLRPGSGAQVPMVRC